MMCVSFPLQTAIRKPANHEIEGDSTCVRHSPLCRGATDVMRTSEGVVLRIESLQERDAPFAATPVSPGDTFNILIDKHPWNGPQSPWYARTSCHEVALTPAWLPICDTG